jgi:pimeloyl-ACP methyl ester carboxylesterase
MCTFGLVHGAGLGAWCWDGTIRELEAYGCRAIAVDLSPSYSSEGAERLTEFLLDAFAGCDDLILVGHSMSGLITPIVAARRPVKRMIFLHAILPWPGKSFDDQLRAEPDLFNLEMLAVPPEAWSDGATATRFLYHDCTPEVAQEACARLRVAKGGSRLIVNEITPLQAWPDVPSSYIVCRDDRTITPSWARQAARKRLGVEPIELPGGHCPMLSRPRECAAALRRCLEADSGAKPQA